MSSRLHREEGGGEKIGREGEGDREREGGEERDGELIESDSCRNE